VSIIRASEGVIQNEKRYILPPTPVTRFLLGGEMEGNTDGFVKCNLSQFQSSSVKDNRHVNVQVVFTGTQNPFRYGADGSKIYSREEELQYGNGICGVESIELSVDMVVSIVRVPRWIDDFTKDIDPETNQQREDVRFVRQLRPTVRFRKFNKQGSDLKLIDKINNMCNEIPAGEILVVFSHKNVDNLAKYHLLNRSSNLFFYGSLSSNKNQIQHDGLVVDVSTKLKVDEDGRYQSTSLDGEGNPYLEFSIDDVYTKDNSGNIEPSASKPPCFVKDSHDREWILQQGRDYPDDGYETLEPGVEDDGKPNDVWIDESKQYVEDGDGRSMLPRKRINPSDVVYKKPGIGGFTWAHRTRDVKPQNYIDYLYVKNGSLAFKISEESESFADAMSMIPPFFIDERLKNKLQDLNDIQILDECSTFIHQSEDPNKVKDCGAFNPLVVDAVLNYGLEGRDGGKENELIEVDIPEDGQTTSPVRVFELDNLTDETRLKLQLEDGEIDDYLKIYTNYVRREDGHGDWHYDLYFNIQNLFKSPFEYISSVTKQANVLVIPDSYLYLTGDKFRESEDKTHNEIDDKKMKVIKEGGELSIYGQVKSYSNDMLSDVKTIKLFTYKIHNISDDKPKFLI